MNKNKIIFADDDKDFRESISLALNFNKDMPLQVLEASDGPEVFEILEEDRDVDCILLDFDYERFGGPGQMNGFQIADKLKEIVPHIPIIMTSVLRNRGDIAMQAAKNNIIDFLDKPFGTDEVIQKLKKIITQKSEPKNKVFQKAEKELAGQNYKTKSPVMEKVFEQIYKAAKTDGDILLLGETGTGKSTLAKMIHEISNRSDREFKSFSCAAFAPGLIESELFGHKRGAFNGATEDKKGIFDIIGDGTLLLDELAELSFELQNKLLFVTGKQKEYHPVGDPGNTKSVKCRIIAASLKEPTDENWRKDLFSRFKTVIKIPPLRDRTEDIPFFIKIFMADYHSKSGYPIDIEERAVNLLQRQSWLGNLHQLSRVIENCIDNIFFDERKLITIKDIQEELKNEYGFFQDNDKTESIADLTKKLAMKLIDNKDKILQKAEVEAKGGIKAIMSIIEKELIRETLKRTPNVYSASLYIRENKDTFRNKAEKHGLIDK